MREEQRVVRTIRQVMPAVVSVVVAEKLEDFEKGLTPDVLAELPKSQDGKLMVPEELVDHQGMVEVGGGSGFIVGADGIIVTNKHVVSEADAKYYVVVNGEEKRYLATILSRDPVNDVAILKIDATGLPALKLGDATDLELGQDVIAIGNALNVFKNTVSKGIVSGLSRSVQAQADPKSPPQEMRGLIQTDAAINPGNSGGPLVDMRGLVVGINAAIVSGAHSIGLAIPINTVKRDLHDLRKYGRIRRALLGLRYIVIDERLAEKKGLSVSHGAWIMRETPKDHAVIPGSPAAEAGIKEKDIVLEANGRKIDREYSIQDALEILNVGDTLEMKVLRGDKEFTAKAVLAERK